MERQLRLECDGVRAPKTVPPGEGLDAGKPYYINEDEVTQTGTRLTVSYRRTRWHNGRVVVWLAARAPAAWPSTPSSTTPSRTRRRLWTT